MADEPSEEKSLPASRRKLQKIREKGQVVTAKEAVTSIVTIAALIYLYAMRASIAEKLMALWELGPLLDERGFAVALAAHMDILSQLALQLVAPLFGLVIAVSVLVGMLISGGPVFAAESIMPNFDKLNPGAGIKRIFGRRALMAFGMHVIRFALLAGIFTLVVIGGWQAAMLAPMCGFPCAVDVLRGMALPLVVAAAATMSAMAVFDYLVSRSEFMREQRMTKTEMKQEMKDMMGDPHLQGQLKRDRKQALTGEQVGAGRANLVLTNGSKLAVAVRYVQGETPAPVVVARSRGPEAGRRLMRAAKGPAIDDPDLVAALGKHQVGRYVVEDALIKDLAPHLHRAIAEAA